MAPRLVLRPDHRELCQCDECRRYRNTVRQRNFRVTGKSGKADVMTERMEAYWKRVETPVETFRRWPSTLSGLGTK
jgi:hypothetical protein